MTKQSLGTTTTTQIGIIVADIEAKVKAWADVLGVPVPEITITDTVDVTKTGHKGQSSCVLIMTPKMKFNMEIR